MTPYFSQKQSILPSPEYILRWSTLNYFVYPHETTCTSSYCCCGYVFAVCVRGTVCVRSTVYVRSMCSQHSICSYYSMCSQYVFAVLYVLESIWGGVGNVSCRGRASFDDVGSNKWSVSTWSCLFVLAPDLSWVSALTAMPPFFAVRLHRGGKLCISDGGSLWVGKSAGLLRLNHNQQVASCVRDLPQLGCGEMSVSVSPRVLQLNKNGCSMNKIG